MRKSTRTATVKLCYQEESDYQLDAEFGIGKEKEKVYSKWTREENKQYAKFLANNISQFGRNDDRRSLYFFNKMASALKIGRNNQQCRSHHQKMEKKYKTAETIIKVFLGLQFSLPQPKEQTRFNSEVFNIQKEDPQSPSTEFGLEKKTEDIERLDTLKFYEDEEMRTEENSNLFNFFQTSFDFFIF